jgi:membrane-bound inhibitor of C-type lysozyme
MNRLALVGVLVAGLMGTVYAADPSFDCQMAKPNSIESVICSSALLSALAYITRMKKRSTLEIQPSGSGAKYMGVGGETFWEHHGEALYQEGNHAPEVTCKQEPIG